MIFIEIQVKCMVQEEMIKCVSINHLKTFFWRSQFSQGRENRFQDLNLGSN